jgi:hypothetical protein
VIHQWNDERTGYAQFSDDEVMRYHLIRLVSDRAIAVGGGAILPLLWKRPSRDVHDLKIATFLMLNPSTATAFKPDPTVGECTKFTRRWGYDVTWVVNQHAFRSPFPVDLKKRAVGQRGDDAANDDAIMMACRLADISIAAWGNDGDLDGRATHVVNMLKDIGVVLHHLGITKSGAPKHPLARGVHRIPADQQPAQWSHP